MSNPMNLRVSSFWWIGLVGIVLWGTTSSLLSQEASFSLRGQSIAGQRSFANRLQVQNAPLPWSMAH